jgi:hypothetical protein
MMHIQHFKEDIKYRHWDRSGLEGFIYYDIFEPFFFNTVKKTVKSKLAEQETKTYLTHQTSFNIDNKHVKIASHAQNGREQCVIHDLTFIKEWYSQTSDSIKEWSDNKLKESISPVFYKCINIVENLDPFVKDKDSWIFYRLHLNYLAHDEHLALHLDAAMHVFKPIPGYIDHSAVRMYSMTFYLYDHIENMGGELWTPNGFVFKPKENSALLINGHQATHGVTVNMNPEPRLAFTLRIAHKDDLFLPGSKDKFLYDVTQNTI